MTELLTALATMFIIAGPFVLLAKRLDLSAIPALVVSGVFAGLVIDEGLLIELARLGIAFLVFTLSIKIHTESVRTVVSDSEVVAIAQAVLVGSLGFGAAVLFGLAPANAIYVAVAGALSSTIVGTTVFQSAYGGLVRDRLSSSIHSVQDLLAILVLIVLGAGTFALDPVATQLGYGVILLATAVVVNRYLFTIIDLLSKGSDESMLIGIVALLIVFLGLADFLGISIVVGAFAAGIAVRDDPVTYSDVLNGLESIKDFFAAIFFITIGALVPVATLDLEILAIALGLTVLTVLVKPAVTVALLVYKGYNRRSATLSGFDLDHVSEFAIIVAIEAFVLGILAVTVFEGIMLAAALTLITSSITWYYDEEIYRALVTRGLLGRPYHSIDDWKVVPDDLSDHIVIVGYGRQGRRLVSFCEEVGQPYVVVETDPVLLDDIRADCAAYVFGDIIEPEVWRAANLGEARLAVSTVDTKPVTDHLLGFADEVDVIVRTSNVAGAADLLERGALYVSVADILAADQLSERIESLVEGTYDRERLREESLGGLDVESEPHLPSTRPSERL